jgi:hypothetical protein
MATGAEIETSAWRFSHTERRGPSAAAGGAVGVPGSDKVIIELPLSRQGTIRMAAAEVLEVGRVIRHPRDLAQEGK